MVNLISFKEKYHYFINKLMNYMGFYVYLKLFKTCYQFWVMLFRVGLPLFYGWSQIALTGAC